MGVKASSEMPSAFCHTGAGKFTIQFGEHFAMVAPCAPASVSVPRGGGQQQRQASPPCVPRSGYALPTPGARGAPGHVALDRKSQSQTDQNADVGELNPVQPTVAHIRNF